MKILFATFVFLLAQMVTAQDGGTAFTPDSLLRLYESDKKAAKRLSGATITLTGRPDAASPKRLVFRAYTRDKLTCSFAISDIDTAKFIGKVVAITGRVRGRGFMGNVTLDDCTVTSALDVSGDEPLTISSDTTSVISTNSQADPASVASQELPDPPSAPPAPSDSSAVSLTLSEAPSADPTPSSNLPSIDPQTTAGGVDNAEQSNGTKSNNNSSYGTFIGLLIGFVFVICLWRFLRRKCPNCKERQFSTTDETCVDTWIGSRTVQDKTKNSKGETIATTTSTIPVTKEKWVTTYHCNLCGYIWREQATIERS